VRDQVWPTDQALAGKVAKARGRLRSATSRARGGGGGGGGSERRLALKGTTARQETRARPRRTVKEIGTPAHETGPPPARHLLMVRRDEGGARRTRGRTASQLTRNFLQGQGIVDARQFAALERKAGQKRKAENRRTRTGARLRRRDRKRSTAAAIPTTPWRNPASPRRNEAPVVNMTPWKEV